MTFPVYIHLFGVTLHPHTVFEILAYGLGSRLFFFLRKRSAGRQPSLPIEKTLLLLCGCTVGALLGAKLLALAESWREISAAAAANPLAWVAGKTIVGGILGGWIGVEIAKKLTGVRKSTGDTFVFPLILGIAIGRVGCFLTGLEDHTHGNANALPWAVDFGDGVRRHPTQLYEIAYLATLAIVLVLPPVRRLWSVPAGQVQSGRLFRLFVIGYLSFRFAIEFIKPTDKTLLGLSAIQWASLLAVGWTAVQLLRKRSPQAIDSSPSAIERGAAS
ncbi:prolipoprotein diacylglyceryl transferase [Humisphaera borealis]|uniref:Prolipoprotein diacylglyceryl transferase n=1 Tax=Humisphaera borealis TaxID=2807512 RepID=A0A7M2X1D8_9BACT|nr:prolipoprotein diacylglyceryl transferase family protein [Humisphaera borealis]QOV91557.1 prolipoprotein diacylglyceryl transferase [Humisphaera borealis]